MRNRIAFRKFGRMAAVALIIGLVALGLGGATFAQETGPKVRVNAPEMVAAAAMPRTGLVCTTNPSASFTLTTKQGYIALPDGNMVYTWGLSEGQGRFQHPSPVLCVNEGQTVTVVLHNTLAEPISLIFPGQENVSANGAPVQPQFDGSGNLVSLAQTAAANGGSVTYSFVASRPGTFLYESGTDAIKQVNMGLFGALVVRPGGTYVDPADGLTKPYFDPANGVCHAYNDPGTRYKCSTEYLMLLSELDPVLHTSVEQAQPYDLTDLRVRYWLINGRSFPDTMSDNGATWLPNQPYSALVHIHPLDSVANPYPALMRYVTITTENSGHHPHGNHQRVIAQDGNLLLGNQKLDGTFEDASYEKFAVLVGPGQTWDMLFDWQNIDGWHPTDKPIPVTIPQLQDLVTGPYYSGSPYLGNLEALPVGTQALNQCGEYYHISHNHQLQKITAWGMVLAGQITFTRIDPPLPNLCP